MKQIQINQTSVGQQDYNLVEKVGEDINVFSPSLYKAIDLDLPSGNLWADRNVGAATPEDAGLYFQWGDTQGYTAEQVGVDKQFDRNYSDYKWRSDGDFTKYNTVDKKVTLDLEDDAAHIIMGDNWRISTSEELVELFKNTDFYLITNDDREVSGNIVEEDPLGTTILKFQFEESPSTYKGIRFYKKGDHSVSLFVPSAGRAHDSSLESVGVYFWASSRFPVPDFTFSCMFGNGRSQVGAYDRYNGLSIRGIMPNV